MIWLDSLIVRAYIQVTPEMPLSATSATARLAADVAALLRTTPERLPVRLYGMGYRRTCERCSGSGSYSFNQIDGSRCFGCDGRGEVAAKLSADLVTRVQSDVAGGALDRYLAQLMLDKETERRGRVAGKRLLDLYGASFTYGYFYNEQDQRSPNYSGLRFAYIARVHIDAHEAAGLAVSRYLTPEDRLEVLRRLAAFVDIYDAHIQAVDACLKADIKRGLVAQRQAEYVAWHAQWVLDGRPSHVEDAHRLAGRVQAQADLAHVPAKPEIDVSDFAAKAKAARRASR